MHNHLLLLIIVHLYEIGTTYFWRKEKKTEFLIIMCSTQIGRKLFHSIAREMIAPWWLCTSSTESTVYFVLYTYHKWFYDRSLMYVLSDSNRRGRIAEYASYWWFKFIPGSLFGREPLVVDCCTLLRTKGISGRPTRFATLKYLRHSWCHIFSQ